MNGKSACSDDGGGLQGAPQSIQKQPCPNAAPLPFAMHGKPRQNEEGDRMPWHTFDDPHGRVGVAHFSGNNRVISNNRLVA